MPKDPKDARNPLKIDRETLSQLDDEQLRQIAGGAIGGNPDEADEEESCSYVGSCYTCCNHNGPV